MSGIRVLHFEESRIDADAVRELLVSAGLLGDVAHVATREDYVAALERGGFDVILAEYSPPGLDGLAALEIAQQRCPDVPFLFVTGVLQDDTAVETLRRGASDFIVKKRLGRLVPAIQRALRERDERAQRARAESALQFLVSASARLATSLDVQSILGNFTHLAIPTLADFCVVDLVTHDGEAELVASAHVDPAKTGLTERLRFRSMLTARGIAELYDAVPEERIRALVGSDEQRAILQALEPRALMLVPMVVNGRTLGNIAFGVSVSKRRYNGRDPRPHRIWRNERPSPSRTRACIASFRARCDRAKICSRSFRTICAIPCRTFCSRRTCSIPR